MTFEDQTPRINYMAHNNETHNHLVVALRPQTQKHIRGGWSHYTDTCEPVDGGVGTLQL
jgi:hypothetical protein